MSQRQPKVVLYALLGILAFSRVGASQFPTRLDLGSAIEVGGEAERYLRVLQLAGVTPRTSWAIQPFSPSQMRRFRATKGHPWSARFDTSEAAARLLRPRAKLIENTAYPFQDGTGPTWAGRGLTLELQAGGAFRWKSLTAQLAPLFSATQNGSFALAPNGISTPNGEFADARFPQTIDAPQRFGNRAFTRVNWGTSTITWDDRGVVIALSNSPQRWGPARDYPLVLGPNAGGFPTLYLGTASPVDLWLFRLHARVIYSDLAQSEFTRAVDDESRRLGSGTVGAITVRGLPSLELGGARFVHRLWPEGGLTADDFKRPFSGGLNILGSAPNAGLENQVASLFARWTVSRAEFYGELYREDFPGHFHNSLSLIEKPDDLASFTVGFQRVFVVSADRITVLRGELVNGQTSHQERRVRGFDTPIPPYVHTTLTQGHTVNGLILGSPEAYGGAAWRLGVDRYEAKGRRTITLERSLRFDWLPTEPNVRPVHPDVIYALRGEMLRFSQARDYTITLIPSIDLNRNLVAHHDVFNLTAAVTVRGWP